MVSSLYHLHASLSRGQNFLRGTIEHQGDYKIPIGEELHGRQQTRVCLEAEIDPQKVFTTQRHLMNKKHAAIGCTQTQGACAAPSHKHSKQASGLAFVPFFSGTAKMLMKREKLLL